MTKTQERDQFVSIMTREFPGVSAAKLDRLIRLARRHGRIAERECNGHQTYSGDWDEAAAKRDERLCERVEAEIRTLCSAIGAEVKFQGDPRGSTVKVKAPSGRGNDFGGEGLVCVPQ